MGFYGANIGAVQMLHQARPSVYLMELSSLLGLGRCEIVSGSRGTRTGSTVAAGRTTAAG